jgi:trigger factor
VQRFLEDFRKKAERTVNIDESRGLERGDVAVVDFASRQGEEPVANGAAENFQLDVDDNLFVEGFADRLVGLKVDEKRTFDFDFPESYGNKNLAGRKITFDFHLKAIKKRELPALDDDLAREVSRFESLDELKRSIRERLERNLKSEIGSRVLDLLAQKKEFLLPKAFVQQTIHLILENQARQLSQVGIRFDDFLKGRGVSIEQLVGELHPQAERLARSEVIREAVIQAEELKVDDNDLEAEIVRFGEATNQDPEAVRKTIEERGDLESFRREILRQKVLDLLAARAQVVKTKPGAADSDEDTIPSKVELEASGDETPAEKKGEASPAADAGGEEEA